MKNISPELRSLWQSLAEAEGDEPGFDYDRGYLTGWHDQHRSIKRRRPDGGYRERQRVTEFRLGYKHGREDGTCHPDVPDWWPGFARGWGSTSAPHPTLEHEGLAPRSGSGAALGHRVDPEVATPDAGREAAA
jgi:hypothetical protein